MAKIKEFCENYKNRATDKLKNDYLKENLKITTYLPFIKKDALAQNIVNATTLLMLLHISLKITQMKMEQLDAEELIRFKLTLLHRCCFSIVLL